MTLRDSIRFWFAASLLLGAAPALARAATPARQIAGIVSDADYPNEALRARREGRAIVAIRIGKDGRPAHVAARDERGRKVPETRRVAVSWRLPIEASVVPQDVSAVPR